MRPRRRSKNPLFDDAFWASNPLGTNLVFATNGATYGALRKLSDVTIISYVDSLVLEPSFRADIDFYMRELRRREQARMNKILVLLTIVATVATVLGAFAAILALILALR